MSKKYIDMTAEEICEKFKEISRQRVSQIIKNYATLPDNVSEGYLLWKKWNAANRDNSFSWKYATEDEIYAELMRRGTLSNITKSNKDNVNYIPAMRRYQRTMDREYINYEIASVEEILQH